MTWCRALAAGALLLACVAVSHGDGALASAPAADEAPTRARALALQREAADRLQRAADASLTAGERLRMLKEAGQAMAALQAEPEASGREGPLPSALRAELGRAAAELSALTEPALSLEPYRKLIDRVGARLRGEPPLGLSFQGSYAQTKVAEPAVGGHASAMGPAPMQVPASEDAAGAPSPVELVEGPGLDARSYCGGPTKDHILESGGSGIALLDYDGDGLLDIYVVTAGELDERRQPVFHKNALYKNLGNWKFKDVSREAGVDAAAWGNGVCAGDFDDDGKLDLYVTNFGPNFLFRNNGNGTFTETAAKAGVQAGGWSTGCTFFDAKGDGKLDLYVARYVATTWEEVRKAERTLTWRGGPKTMVGPVGLPGEADLFFENRGDGTFVEAAHAHGLNDSAKATASGSWPPTTTATASWTSSWPTTPFPTSSTTTGATGRSRALAS